jgi:ATP-binding cassette subfamily E protein 1
MTEFSYVLVVEHDLSILDYLSDFVCVLYGQQGCFLFYYYFNHCFIGYGVVTFPMGVRDGINVFLAGHIPSENMRFRPFELSFKVYLFFYFVCIFV